MLRELVNSGHAQHGHGPLTQMSVREVMRAVAVVATTILVALAWTRNVNWDEFYFLSQVYANQDGRLDRPLQTAFVHAFGWIAHVPGHEMGQIFVARLVMTALFATTVFSIHRISRELTERDAADIAVIAFLTSGFVLAHSTSFRADPIAAAFLMGALAIMMTGRMSAWQIVAVALLSAGGLLVTIKAVFYLPAYLGALVWRWDDRRVVLRILLAGIIGLAVAAGLYIGHAAGIVSAPGNETTANAHNALTTALLDAGLVPRSREALLWALLSIGAVMLALLGLTAPGSIRTRLVRMGLVLPLVLSVLFYRNAFPYFFAYITPPFMVVAAVGASALGRGRALGALVTLMLATGTGQAVKALSEGAGLQRATLAEVHRLFPDPVHYIDHNAMVASFPRADFFMSTWGLARYRAAGQPVMADQIEHTAPPLLLANRWALHHAMTAPRVQDHPMLLLPDDQAVLRSAYVHYSGVIWLAGREVMLGAEPETIVLPIPGRYRLESAAPVMIDGQMLTDGMTLDISTPVVATGAANQSFRLVWDTHGAPRPNALPSGGVYAGFWQLPF
ncbi:hypothetical protein DC363_08080 [Thalassorhabdomicrobium marinisediminis]|uniref:Glycosyltransferase RgtA/B/C/D-like domain-containing protein n=2 Tax=Thalassorhabdomicrobium marinisediminis TaxID=2170577 RepID=A0A2T7FY46_9RHOB|nr:hypothetical protein DC363_08080 [Thalassorhabdomicrobium marinisediminis]